MSYIKLFPYVFFGCTVLGAMGNMLWFSHGYNDFLSLLKIATEMAVSILDKARDTRFQHRQDM